MARPLWLVNIIKKTFPNVNNIAKLTNVPILGKLLDKLFFKGDNIFYLPMDRVIPVNGKVENPGNLVLPSDVAKYFINKANHHWIMNFCICRESLDCQDYPQDLGCLFLGEAIKDINPQLGRVVSKEEALEHINKCREAGLVHLIGKNRLDKQWLGVANGDKLLTICNCDPCCCLWRMTPFLSPSIGKNIKKMSGVHVSVTEKCVGCGKCCDNVCFVGAVSLINDKAIIDQGKCLGCGRCVDICPNEAIHIQLNDPDFINKSIKEIEQKVDVE